jgi:hypothetical protein
LCRRNAHFACARPARNQSQPDAGYAAVTQILHQPERDLWHFHFYGETPLKLVAGRERIYFEHFWNDFAADRNHSVPEADQQFYA